MRGDNKITPSKKHQHVYDSAADADADADAAARKERFGGSG